ncbi:MAG TPA: type II toxin-antitoxin system RelE/ParE family toxin [Rhodospirillaceae bacterium]|nr:type II toxin-antitoxin system RelE/ParE family toxin [Rhodospirillaceae bacterium]
MRVIWTATALADISRTYQYIEAENPRAAQLVAKALRDLGDSLPSFSS